MSLPAALWFILTWDFVVLVLFSARKLYRRSQGRLSRATDDRERYARLYGPDEAPATEPAPVTGSVPLVIKGEVVDLAECPAPSWMDRT